MHLLPPNDQEFSVETRDASPANLLMKIQSFSLLSKYGIREYESREFDAGGYKWKLIIYPEGLVREVEGESGEKKREEHVCVYLSMTATSSLPLDWEVNAIFTFFLHNHISDNYLSFRGMSRRFNAVNPKWGFPKLISKKMLMDPSNGYLVDDNCVFGAEVFVIKRQLVVECLSLLHDPSLKCEWKVSRSADVWNSEVLVAGGLKWRVDLYPNGNVAAKGTHISIFMYCVDCETFAPHERVKADVTFRIKDDYSKQLNNWFISSSKSWGYSKFMPISDLGDASKGYLVDGCFCLEIEISVQAVVRDSAKI